MSCEPMVGTPSLSSGAHSRDRLALPTLRDCIAADQPSVTERAYGTAVRTGKGLWVDHAATSPNDPEQTLGLARQQRDVLRYHAVF
jgi:hypothetical protein